MGGAGGIFVYSIKGTVSHTEKRSELDTPGFINIGIMERIVLDELKSGTLYLGYGVQCSHLGVVGLE
jgi:hypothetical protein